jgi:miniconductance mechanosensitive channel
MISGITINNFSGYSYFVILISLILTGTGLIIAFSHYFAKYVLISFIDKAFDKKRTGLAHIIFNNRLLHRIAYLVPAFIMYRFSYLFNFEYPHLKLFLADFVREISNVYIIIGSAFVLSALLNCLNDRYSQLVISKSKPIKSYLQITKLIIFSITSVLVASSIFNKSPAYFFAGAGATTAFLALIFKDSLLGFIASIQLAAYDMVRIGDWIEMPNFGADGEVMEISLNTVKVQNFDKTIVTIPSYALLTSGLKNWRGMHESGGRRVKRGIIIDINSIKMSDQYLFDQLRDVNPLMDNIIQQTNPSTNIGLFRFYLENYLKQHPGVHKNMKILIRQTQGTPTGLPLELYFFTNETDSEKYEAIQSDIIEHVYAIMPRFDLRVFQYANA